MQKFGEMCIASFKDNTHQAKLANRGTPGIWVGYAENHPACTYRIFNPKTKKIILTQDVTFLQKSYGEYTKVEKPAFLTMCYEGSDDQEELETVPVENNNNNNVNVVSDSDSDSSDEDFKSIKENLFDDDIEDQVKASPGTTVNAKVAQAMKKLQASYNDDANKIIKEAMQDKVIENLNFLINLAMVTTDTMPVLEEPMTLNEAWDHPNANTHAKWQEAICYEFTNMNKQQVWCKTSKTLMHPN